MLVTTKESSMSRIFRFFLVAGRCYCTCVCQPGAVNDDVSGGRATNDDGDEDVRLVSVFLFEECSIIAY